MNDNAANDSDRLIGLTADVVSAYVSNNPVPTTELPDLIARVHAARQNRAAAPAVEASEPQRPAVPIRKSVMPDYIVCLEDGEQFKSLKRHLATRYGLTPDEYRAKWGLPADYPMAAPNYASLRSALAKSMGLGRNAEPGETVSSVRSGRRRVGPTVT